MRWFTGYDFYYLVHFLYLSLLSLYIQSLKNVSQTTKSQVSLYIYISIYIYIYIYLSIYLSIYLPIYLFIYLLIVYCVKCVLRRKHYIKSLPLLLFSVLLLNIFSERMVRCNCRSLCSQSQTFTGKSLTFFLVTHIAYSLLLIIRRGTEIN